jgi:hypothetical protein
MTAPLFVADLATLKKKLRLSGVPPDPSVDADALIDEAILAVRLGFYRELGIATVALLQATAFNPAPSTDADIRRALANTTEVNWVRLELMPRMPWLWSDSSGEAQKIWNEEAPFREKGAPTFKGLQERLEKDVQDALDILSGREALGEETGIHAFTGEPAAGEEAPTIGDSLGKLRPDEAIHQFQSPNVGT